MAITSKSLRQFQWAREVTPGTDLAATSKIALPNLEFEGEEVFERPKLAKGLITRAPGNETVVKRGTRWSFPDSELNYEQLQNWLSMAVKGGVTPTGAGPYVWTFTRSLTTDPALDAFTFERRLNTGANQVDHAWHYAMMTRIGFRGAQGSSLKFNGEGFARRRQSEAFTAALTMPTPEIPAFGHTKLFLDANWAGLGGTQIVGQLYGFSLDFFTGAMPEETAEGRTDLDYSIDVLNGDEVGMSLELLVLLDHSRYATELGNAEDQNLRAVRLQVDNGGGGAAARQIQLDGLYKYESTPLKIDEKDGQDIVSLRLIDATDGTNLFQAKVTNGIATLV